MHYFSDTPDPAHLFTYFPMLHSITGMSPTPFSPSLSPHLSASIITYTTTYLLTPKCSLLSSSFFMLLAFLKGKKLLRCHMEVRPWMTEFVMTVVRRGGMLRAMILEWECTRFYAVVLNAYNECPALVQEDIIILSASQLAPCPPNTYSPKINQLI